MKGRSADILASNTTLRYNHSSVWEVLIPVMSEMELHLRQMSTQSHISVQFSSATQSCPTLRPHGRQHARLPCPSPSPTLIPSAQRLVWAAKQPLGKAALGALFA